MIDEENLIIFLMEEFDETPCNINSYDEFMFDNNNDWCDKNCGREGTYKECWKQLLKLKGVLK